jgi:hypothetical protein
MMAKNAKGLASSSIGYDRMYSQYRYVPYWRLRYIGRMPVASYYIQYIARRKTKAFAQ